MGDDGGGIGNLLTILVILGLCIFLGYYLCLIKKTPAPLVNIFRKISPNWPGCDGSTAPGPPPPSGTNTPPGPSPPNNRSAKPTSYAPLGYSHFMPCVGGGPTIVKTLKCPHMEIGVQGTEENTKVCIDECAGLCKENCTAFVYNTGQHKCYINNNNETNITCIDYKNDECCQKMTPGVNCYGMYAKEGTTIGPCEPNDSSYKCGDNGGAVGCS